jgi:hypothetical protein
MKTFACESPNIKFYARLAKGLDRAEKVFPEKLAVLFGENLRALVLSLKPSSAKCLEG